MSIAASKPYFAPRPPEYAQIPDPIRRKNWFGDSNLPGPNPIFADFITATFMINTPRFMHVAVIKSANIEIGRAHV